VTRRLSHIGKELQSRIKVFFDSSPGLDATPLEICQSVLEDVERKVQPVGRGRRIFPYNQITVRLKQAETDRPGLEAAFNGMEAKVRERLGELQCEAPTAIDVRVSFVKKTPAGWTSDQQFSVDYNSETEAAVEPGEKPPRPPLHITIVRGAATEEAYTFTEPNISIGRTADPTDGLGRVRHNRVAFLDTVDGITETVGRAHARLRLEPKTGEYSIFDEGSSNGTSIIRDGATILVPPRDPRGVRVQSGDEIQVGRAVIRVSIQQALGSGL
jgi:hypothetical protein